MVTDRIIDFLRNRNWRVVRENEHSIYLSPPVEYKLPEDYSIIVPRTAEQIDFQRHYKNLLEILADFYNLSKQDLGALLDEGDAILKVRIHDEATSEGKINFIRFEGFIERLKAIITDTASFVIDKNLTSTRTPAEAHRYLNKCHFLQTEKGSYVTNIQLPTKETIKEADLFSSEIVAEEINDKILDVLEYVNTQVFQGVKATDEYIIENESKLNVKLLRDIETLYEKSDINNIYFSLHSIGQTKLVISENVTKEQIHRLSLFIDDVANKSIETKQVTVRGKIEALKSKDPDSGKNSVTIQGIYNDMPVVATANLNSDGYKMAIEAHKIKEYVTIIGLAKTSKTRIRFIEIESFRIV